MAWGSNAKVFSDLRDADIHALASQDGGTVGSHYRGFGEALDALKFVGCGSVQTRFFRIYFRISGIFQSFLRRGRIS
jgi:hypothetical protein